MPLIQNTFRYMERLRSSGQQWLLRAKIVHKKQNDDLELRYPQHHLLIYYIIHFSFYACFFLWLVTPTRMSTPQNQIYLPFIP